MKAMSCVLLAVLLGATPAPAANSRDLTFTSKDGSVLAGTLSWPAADPGARPAFVLIGGSGMVNRDETVGPNATFAELATQLNDAGFAVLRYDKRGVGESTSKTPLPSVTRQLFLDDVLAAVAAAAADPRVDPKRIYLLGHSEGGELAIGAALEGANVAGIVMMAPLSVPYMQVINRQLAALAPAQQATVRQMIAANHVFLDSYAQIDPRVEITKVSQPMLLLYGSKDAQVSPSEIDELVAAARSAKRALIYDELAGDNHLFMTLPPSTNSTGAEYLEVHPLDPRVVTSISSWVRQAGSASN